jgi:autotransporter-associated beta strand protein
LTINGGAVRVGNAGALNSGTPQAVTFGAGATSAAKLQANGNSFTIGGLSTNATPGSPIVENANAAAATLTVSQTANSTFAGLIQNGTGGGALSIVKAGSGTLTLTGGNTYTGTTAVNNGLLLVNGNQTAANGLVSVQTTGALGGTGTVGGAITINSGGRITGGDLTSVGTLTLSSDLSIAAGGIGYFNITNGGSNDLLSIGGTLSIANGGIIRVSPGLTSAAIYNLATYTGANPTLPGVAVFQDLGGNALPANYAFSATGGILRLTVSAASYASPTITIATPIGGTRVMSNQNVALTGVAGNSGNLTLNATLANNGGDLVVSGFSPATPTLAAGTSTGYTASIATGSTLGTRSFSVKSTGSPSDPAVAAATSSLIVLGNRTVTAPASPINLGVLHVNNTVPLAGGFSLTSTQLDSEYTRVTVPNGTNGSVTISGGNPGTAFNGSNSDTRAITGTFATAGTKSGSVVLNTVGEGLAGEVVNNVAVGYTASVFSGQAKYADIGATGSWGPAANWDDLDVLNIGGDGAPGLDGAVSIGDKATFADVGGGPAAVTVNLDGVSPSLAGITLSGVTTAYNIATGSGGTITLQNAATPINATGNAGHRISAVMTGSGGLQKTGAANLQLDGASTYTGATAVTNGVLILNATNAIPATTVVTLGDGATTSGKLQIGTAASSRLQTIAGLNVSGTGTANRVVGGNSTASTLTVNVAANTVNTYTGFLGGPGTNENSLALTKSGQGTLALTQAPTYTGTTTISLGVLQTANASDLAGYVNIVGGGSAAASAVWQTQGTITKTLGTAFGNIRLVGGTGFSAVGGPLTVTLNGGAQVTHNAGNFLDNAGFVFGSTTSDNQVNFTNAINLNTTDGFQRVFYVEKSLVSSNASALLSGVLSSGNNQTGFSKQGGGTLYLSGLNQFGGQLTVVDGFLVAQNNSPVGAAGAFGSGAITSTINVGAGNTPVPTGVGIYISGGDFTVARPFNVVAQTNNPNLAVIFGGLTNNAMAFTGNIATAQNLRITQVATTGLNGLTLSGAITTASGTVKTVTFDNVGAVLYSGVASGLIAFAKMSAGTTTLTGNNSYTGTTTISNGVLQVGSGGTTGTLGSGAVTDNASLVFNRSDTLTVANAISGTGSVTNNGGASNVLNLNGAQSYATLNANAGTTNLNSSFTAPATVNANASSTVNIGASQTLTALNIGGPATFGEEPGLASFGGPTTAAVPEPGTMGLLVVGALGMLARRRRKA